MAQWPGRQDPHTVAARAGGLAWALVALLMLLALLALVAIATAQAARL